MPGDGYPKRGSHFAYKLVRLMGKSCAAQTIGHDACWLVTIIATLEDVKRYSGPVTFFNEQLMPICGLNSRNSFLRARRRAIESGWLHYDQGGKGVAGKYWATIPAELSGIPDHPYDEGLPSQNRTDKWDDNQNLGCQKRTENGAANGTEEKFTVPPEQQERGDNRDKNGATTGTHSYPSPIPSPIPKENPLKSPKGDVGGEAVKRKRRVDRNYSDDFEKFWGVYPPIRKTKKPDAWDAWQLAIKRKSAQEIIAAAVEFAASDLAHDPYCPGPAPWLNQDRWADDRSAWKRPNAKSDSHRVGAGQTYQENQAGVRKTF